MAYIKKEYEIGDVVNYHYSKADRRAEQRKKLPRVEAVSRQTVKQTLADGNRNIGTI
jgi:hypothetical protein